MEIKKPNNLEIKNIAGDFNSIEAKINEDSMSFLFEMMSKSLYSNPIGSIVREITSNCFDSHKEANVEEAVMIRKDEDEEGVYISFKDFGVGLSPERIKKVYMNYFSSTKRGTNEQIGGFGLGSKTPLAYQDSFYITTNFNGVKYQYMLSKGEQLPTLDLLAEDETTDGNGTEIRIYIKNDLDEDRFEKNLKEQLCYFDDVFFVGWNIINDYKIYDANYFKYRNKFQYSDEMHICFGQVSYPIDWKEIEMECIKIPIGVKFEIGELVVTPNREQLRYTDEVKQLVRERVSLARNEILEMYNIQNKPVDNYLDWLEIKNKRSYVCFNPDGNDNEKDILYLNGIKDIEKKHKFPILDGLDFLKIDTLIDEMYSRVGSFTGGKEDKTFYHKFSDLIQSNGGSLIYISEDSQLTEAKNFTFNSGYVFRRVPLKKLIRRTQFRILVKKNKEDSNFNLTQIKSNEFYHFDLGLSIKAYKALKEIRKHIEDRFEKYRDLTEEEVKTFKEWKNENNKSLQRKLSGKVLVKDIGRGSDYEWNIYNNFIKNKKGKTKVVFGIEGYKGIVVYGNRGDKDKLEEVEKLLLQIPSLRDKSGLLKPMAAKVILISKQNEKHFNKENMVHVKDFYSDNIIFRRIASSMKIRRFLGIYLKYQSSSNINFIKSIKNIYQPIGDKLEFLLNYSNKYYNREQIISPEVIDSILEVAESNNLFDLSISNVMQEVENWFKDIEILKFTEITNESLPYILRYIKEKGKKINYDYYVKYTYSDKTSKNTNKYGQVIIMFPEQEEAEPKSKFRILTEKIA